MRIARNDVPVLKLVGSPYITCPTCDGLGHVQCPPKLIMRMDGDGYIVDPATGHPIPCPTCRGKKIVIVEQPDNA